MDDPEKETKEDGTEPANPHDQEIRYDPLPGYRPLFFLLLTMAGSYLAYVFQSATHG